MWYITLIPGALLGAGLALIIATLLPRQSKLSAVMERMGTTSTIADHSGTDLETRVGSWVHSRLPDLPGFTIPTKDLELVGTPVNNYLYQKARDALLLLIAPSFAGLALNMAGAPFVGGVAALSGLPLAILGWTGADRDLKKKATVARQEFARGVAIYLELVATERRRNAPVTRALENAATIGDSWVFVRIREELRRARFAGTPSWEALNNFADATGVPELAEVARISRSADESGSSIYETLRSTGKGMRVKLLNDEQTRANKLSDQFSSFAGFIVAMIAVGIIFTPLLFNLAST